jgi:Tfp pilus assembly protein FimT
MGAINLARSEAILRNSPVSLCPSRMFRTGIPDCDGTYADGWLVFSNRDRDRTVDAGVDEVLQVFPPLPPGYAVTNRAGTRPVTDTISYLPDGSSRANTTLLLCTPPGVDVEPLGIVVNIAGRPRLARGWGQCLRG